MTRRRNRAAPPPREPSRAERRVRWAVLALAVTGALSYANAVSAPPLLDDSATLFEDRCNWTPVPTICGLPPGERFSTVE